MFKLIRIREGKIIETIDIKHILKFNELYKLISEKINLINAFGIHIEYYDGYNGDIYEYKQLKKMLSYNFKIIKEVNIIINYSENDVIEEWYFIKMLKSDCFGMEIR